MKQIEVCADQRHQTWCIHCGTEIGKAPTSQDHIPSKALREKPYPANLPVIEICRSCNAGFSNDEQYLSVFPSVVQSGSTVPDAQLSPKASRTLFRSDKLRKRLERAKVTWRSRSGETQTTWFAETDRVSRILAKNARGHVYYESGEPMLNIPDYIRFLPTNMMSNEQLQAFETIDMGAGWPEVGSRMMSRLLAGQDLDSGWITVQSGVYRYAILPGARMTVKMMLSEYLAAEVGWDTE